MTRLLELDTVQMRFGGVTALDDVSFHVDQGEILGLIGPNGAGKTTVFNVVTGVYRPTAGVVALRRPDAAGRSAAPTSPSWASPARSRTSGSSRS